MDVTSKKWIKGTQNQYRIQINRMKWLKHVIRMNEDDIEKRVCEGKVEAIQICDSHTVTLFTRLCL